MPPVAPVYYAHSAGKPVPNPDWRLLRDHLEGVAMLAGDFAAETGVPGLAAAAEAAGWLHDLGKYRASFQRYIREMSPMGSKAHKEAGAAWAAMRGSTPLALAILGHHVGMPDRDGAASAVKGPDGRPIAGEVEAVAQGECPELGRLEIPQRNDTTAATELFTRVLLSCLVDADWTDTGEHERRYKGWPGFPRPPALDPAVRLAKLLAAIDERAAEMRPTNPSLADTRREVLDACLAAAERPRGMFTLTVPTGGGKTLSAMAFALKHAAKNSGLRRVIYVAPYISILDQNAAVIRGALGLGRDDLDLFEHQSLAEPRGSDAADEKQTAAAARRAETWDAPLVVTTNVQFFESLFSNRPGRCRKLHNVAGSVVILDECQSLPKDLVKPTCQMLKQLVGELGCTVVLCTATQPAFDHETLGEHRLTAHRIIPPGLDLFARLERVRLVWPKGRDEALTWAEVAARMAESGTDSPVRPAKSEDSSTGVKHPRPNAGSALAIVNTKAAAKELFRELKSRSHHAYHLSTSLCPAHRVAVLDRVKRLLELKEPVLVASMQLIEAGVDIDFPAVFREMAPPESVIQAAGRCNREGRIPDAGGRVVVFWGVEKKLPPDRWYKAGREVLEMNFLNAGREPRIDAPEDINAYFGRLYWTGDLDERKVLGMRAGFLFESCAKAYRLIDEDTVPVVIAKWAGHEAEVAALLDAVRERPTRANFRALAPFQVNVFRSEIARLPEGLAVPLSEETDLLVWRGVYDDELGRVPAMPELNDSY